MKNAFALRKRLSPLYMNLTGAAHAAASPGVRIAQLTPARPFFCREVELNPIIYREGLNFGAYVHTIYFTIVWVGEGLSFSCPARQFPEIVSLAN